MNNLSRVSRLVLWIVGFLGCLCVQAQTLEVSTAPNVTSSSDAVQGKTLLQSKCAQCHTDSIWRDQRQDLRAWEATLYRMMGRGAVWSGSDIRAMASYLATDFGPQSPRVFTPQ